MASPSRHTSRSDHYMYDFFFFFGGGVLRIGEDEGDVEGFLTGSAARTGVDGFIPLVGTGHGEGALVHAVFAAAERRAARLEGCAAVGVGSAWKTSDKRTRK